MKPATKPAPLFDAAGNDAREARRVPLATRYKEAMTEPTIMDWLETQPTPATEQER